METLATARKELKELIDDIAGVKGARKIFNFKLVRDNGYINDDGSATPPCIYIGEHDTALSLDYNLREGKIYLTYGEGTPVPDGYVFNAYTFYKAWEALS